MYEYNEWMNPQMYGLRTTRFQDFQGQPVLYEVIFN